MGGGGRREGQNFQELKNVQGLEEEEEEVTTKRFKCPIFCPISTQFGFSGQIFKEGLKCEI